MGGEGKIKGKGRGGGGFGPPKNFSQSVDKVYQIESASAGGATVCNAVFCSRSTISCFIPEVLVVKLRSCPKFGPNFGILGRQLLGEGSKISDPVL